MDNEPKIRPWFQVHLSTAIVLMFTAGFIIWANTKVSIKEIDNSQEPHYADEGGIMRDVEYGWPLPVCKFGTFFPEHRPKLPLNINADNVPQPTVGPPDWYHEGFEFWVGCCFIDAIVALAILLSVMIVWERLQRKRTT